MYCGNEWAIRQVLVEGLHLHRPRMDSVQSRGEPWIYPVSRPGCGEGFAELIRILLKSGKHDKLTL